MIALRISYLSRGECKHRWADGKVHIFLKRLSNDRLMIIHVNNKHNIIKDKGGGNMGLYPHSNSGILLLRR